MLGQSRGFVTAGKEKRLIKLKGVKMDKFGTLNRKLKMNEIQKVAPYLKAIEAAENLETAKREAKLALQLLDKIAQKEWKPKK